ncbi:MAG: DUF2752 domain-containing protein [Candidatus Alcyoniella australis]|nr:DUF2752 domain-containing protein [Candidatus Alcyoniella australis]
MSKPYAQRPIKAEQIERPLGSGWLSRRIFVLDKRASDEWIYFILFGGVILSTLLIPVFNSAPFDACGFHRATGLPCPGCGSTRAFVAMGHGQFNTAWTFNPSAVVLYLLMLFRWLLSVPAIIRPLKIKLFSSSLTITILVVYLVLHLAHGILRLVLVHQGKIPWPPNI